MKKTFRFLTLGLMLLGGTLTAMAQPAPGTVVGKSVDGVVVTYTVTGAEKTYKTPAGTEYKAIPVQVTELDYDGVTPNKPKNLTIKTSFKEKHLKEIYNFVVEEIASASESNKIAFWAHTNLETLTFEADPEVVPEDAFTFTIGNYSFYGCSNLKTLTLPNNITAIGEYAFQGSAITSFDIPAACATIGKFAFYNCKKLETVTSRSYEKDGKPVGAALTKLDGKVFANSTVSELNLENAYNLTEIGDANPDVGSPFLYKLSEVNHQLKKVILPAQPSADGKTFSNKLEKVNLSFENCSALETIENLQYSSKLTKFDAEAFNGCKSLKELNLPVGKVGDTMFTGTPFVGCVKLEKLNFPDAFAGIIGNGSNLFGIEDADLAALKEIHFLGKTNTHIFNNAFKGCTGLTTVEFKGKLNAVGTQSAEILVNAFQDCESLATLTFAGVEINDAAATENILISNNAFAGTAITAVDFKGINLAKAAAGRIFDVAPNAFESEALTTVVLGAISLSDNAHNVDIHDGAFVSDAITKFEVGAITAKKGSVVTFGDGLLPVIASDALAEVKFATMKFEDDSKVVVKDGAFACDELATVTIGDMLPNADGKTGIVTIGVGAFEGELETVEIGKIGKGITATIDADAFANNATAYEMDETVTIGDVEGKLTLAAGAFTGPQEDDSDFSVTFGNLKSTATLTFADGAIKAAPVGTASYTFGDIECDVTGVGKIYGSVIVNPIAVPTDRNSTVTIGAYKNAFKDWTFTNVKDFTAKTWEPAGTTNDLAEFNNPCTVTIQEDVKTTLNGDKSQNKISDVTIGGVKSKDLIKGFGTEVRNITFARADGKDPIVAIGAVASGAFKAAATDAETDGETITVIYRCEDPGNYNQIFNKTAFADAEDDLVVVLYTTDWAKANTFEHYGDIYRLTLSASDVVPGETIAATLSGVSKNGMYKYGRLYVPKGVGMKYKVDAGVSGGKNTVNLLSGHLDGTNIYMKQLDVNNGFYWIDATEADQVFIVRTSDLTATKVEAVDLEEDDAPKANWWFDKADAEDNCLRYATQEVVNQELQDFAEFMNKTIFVMANPAKYNLAFAKLNQYTSNKGLPQGSIYVVADVDPQAAAGRLNVIFEDGIDTEENTTGIETIEEINVEKNAIYNLQGVRVNKAQKGIYIINGKKVVK